LVKKERQITSNTDGIGVPTIINRRLIKMDMALKGEEIKSISWKTRLVISTSRGDAGSEPGIAAIQDLKIAPTGKWRGTFQICLFNVKEWENRIYIYEPGLLYQFSFPACYGTGQKLVSLCSYKPNLKWTFNLKLAAISYNNQSVTGSGPDQRNGNQKWDIGFQIRYRL
jgi:hypothetical protein